jgi:hypothetical protein
MSLHERFATLKDYVRQHERHISTGALILGAIFDWATITKPDSLFGSVSLASYLVIAGGGIVLLNMRSIRAKESPWLTILIQFCFGNLASGLLVLYSQSASIAGSWLFLLVLAGILIGNEFARERYARLRSHALGFYILLCAYIGFITPVLLKAIGWKIFVLSSVVSLAIMLGYLLILFGVAASRVREDWKGAAVGVLVTTVAFNALYFLNFIPPVPLSLTSIEILHSVSREGTGYRITREEPPQWFDIFSRLRTTVHVTDGSRMVCFSEVYAPVGLTTPIYHHWQKYDQKTRAWVTSTRVAFPISGGRSEGFRGFSFKSGLTDGTWRCSVETEEGALIGRTTFTVAHTDGPVPLIIERR